jgi:CheY-like chemotaxis protein
MATRILVVDDNQLIRRLLTDMLREHGYEVIEALDGHDALHHLVVGKPDLVITDYYMPTMDGAEFLQAVRSGRHCKKNLPVIALAGSRFAEERMTAAGADRYLPKPLREDVLLEAVQSLLVERADG